MIGYVNVRKSLIVMACKKYLAARDRRIQSDKDEYVKEVTGKIERKGFFLRPVVITKEEAERRWHKGSEEIGIRGFLTPKWLSENQGHQIADQIAIVLKVAESVMLDHRVETIAVDLNIYAVLSSYIDRGDQTRVDPPSSYWIDNKRN